MKRKYIIQNLIIACSLSISNLSFSMDKYNLEEQIKEINAQIENSTHAKMTTLQALKEQEQILELKNAELEALEEEFNTLTNQ